MKASLVGVTTHPSSPVDRPETLEQNFHHDLHQQHWRPYESLHWVQLHQWCGDNILHCQDHCCREGMFPQARLVSLQLDEESMKREPLPPAKEAPLTFGSSYVQELLGGDNDGNDKNQPTRKPQFRLRLAISNRLYMILCSVIKVLDMIAKGQQCYHINTYL